MGIRWYKLNMSMGDEEGGDGLRERCGGASGDDTRGGRFCGDERARIPAMMGRVTQERLGLDFGFSDSTNGLAMISSNVARSNCWAAQSCG